MATIKHIQTPDGVIHDVGGGGGSTTYTLTKSGSTITLTGSGGDVSSVVDANTTYALSLSGHTLTLTPSSGSAQSVTIPDDNTTYTIGINGTTITLAPSSGTAQTVTIPDATTTSAGVMSASDKSKLNGIESGAEVNVQSDWNQSNSSADDYIKNKPSLATVATTGDYDDLTNKPSLATVATTGDYDDLTNKPTIPTVNDGTLTIKQNGVTLDTFTANQSGNTTVDITASSGSAQNIWYGTCSTAGATVAKTVTTTTGDFVLDTGNMVRVRFNKANTASSPTINVDGTGATAIEALSGTAVAVGEWSNGEVIDFVYDGTSFVMSEGGHATENRYGRTKLSSSTSSTATDVAATPSAVKAAYDLADSKVSDVEVNGTSVVSGGVASVTVPTATSDLTNDSNFVSDASYVHTDNNFTNADATKLNGIEAGAEVNVQSDWTQADSTADDFIKNKPTLATVATSGRYSDLIDPPNYATVAYTGDYDDLIDKPTIPTVNDGTLTIQKNGTTIDTFTANQSGNTTVDITVPTATQNIWYGTCATGTSTAGKVVTTTTGDFTLATGNMVRVKFNNYNTESSPTLNVDGTGTVSLKIYGTTDSLSRMWRSGEVVDFVYDGTYFVMSDGGTADTNYYGVVKLASSVSSNSTSTGANSLAVKTAYDLADSKSTVSVTQTLSSGTKIAEIDVDGTTTDLYAPSGGGGGTVTDVEVNGSSVVTGGVAEVELKTVNENSIVGTGNVQITKTLTQAQYDALTPAEQNDGTAYFITDADPTPYSASPSAWVQMYHGNQAMNNTATKITGLTISQGGNYDEYFNVGTANQVTIKKTGGYRIDMAMRFSAVTNAANVKRISLYRNGSEFIVLMSRANSWEDFSTFYTQTLSVGDVLTMYGRSEDGNATASIERIYITPIVY